MLGWLEYTLIFARIIPVMMPVLMVCVGALFLKRAQNDPELGPSTKIPNTKNLNNIGKVQLALLENSGVLTDGKMMLSEILVDDIVWNV